MDIGRGYKLGTRVQYRSGYIMVKVENDDGELRMMAEARRLWELTYGPLEEGDRVFHCDGDKTNNQPKNLAKVHFNQTKFVALKESRLLEPWDKVWGTGRRPLPSTKSSMLLPIIRTINKKTGRVLVNS